MYMASHAHLPSKYPPHVESSHVSNGTRNPQPHNAQGKVSLERIPAHRQYANTDREIPSLEMHKASQSRKNSGPSNQQATQGQGHAVGREPHGMSDSTDDESEVEEEPESSRSAMQDARLDG